MVRSRSVALDRQHAPDSERECSRGYKPVMLRRGNEQGGYADQDAVHLPSDGCLQVSRRWLFWVR